MATVVEGDMKAPFSIATTPRCRGGNFSFSGLLYFTLILTLQCWVFSKEVPSNIFLSLWYDPTWEWTLVSRAIGEHWINGDFVGGAFWTQPEELFSQTYSFRSIKISLIITYLFWILVGLKVLTRTVMNYHFTFSLV